jgi:hypothetical protein
MRIIKEAFENIPQESKERVRLLCLEYDINQLKKQIDLCKQGIENGNWENYSENLALRKQRLKEMIEELKKLEDER